MTGLWDRAWARTAIILVFNMVTVMLVSWLSQAMMIWLSSGASAGVLYFAGGAVISFHPLGYLAACVLVAPFWIAAELYGFRKKAIVPMAACGLFIAVFWLCLLTAGLAVLSGDFELGIGFTWPALAAIYAASALAAAVPAFLYVRIWRRRRGQATDIF